MPVLLTGILLFFSAPVQAHTLPNCDAYESVYCDTSWRGFSALLDLLQKYDWVWEREIQQIEAEEHVYIWVRPPFIPSTELRQKIDNGAKILVFDESETSLNWYRDLFGQQAFAVDSPYIPEAAHINGNPNLPVFMVNKRVRTLLQLQSDCHHCRIAFNHPTPFVKTDTKEYSVHKAIFYYVYPSSLQDAKGALYVIRDESFLTRLMLNTVDNGKFLLSLIDSLCSRSSACKLHLLEPHFQFSGETVPEADDTPKSMRTEFQSTLSGIREKSVEAVDNLRKQTESMPLFFIIFVLFSAWSILAFAAAFPWGRTKMKP